ncbi:helix-turn-helix transcriptional regulator [Paenibacillus thalictri]|uniref:AraC family transcriptional regulator n=1 Tax=Paenibacillus thalictri TaxID=2527873 RepID=A0A4Q9DST0_9BACL|nr:AraC family transcriptional regulator [Paenibacillus thalictri]TBL79929.1 AraC family transcriptional regulator [Paenibacillus thalictri]
MKDTTSFSYGAEDDEFYIDHIKRTEPFERNNHFHSNYEIYYLFSGHRMYFIKDRSYAISAGDLVFINKNDVHKTSGTGDPLHERIVINFSDQFIGPDHYLHDPFLFTPFHHNSSVISLKLQDQIAVQAIFGKLEKELKEQSRGFHMYTKHLLVELLLFSARYLEKHETAPFEHASPLHKKISDIVQHINRHYAEQMTLTTLSEQFFISPYYLSRAFKDITSFSFIEYLNFTRIKEAQKLLRETNDKIIEVAQQVGFENIAHFGRVFKKQTKLAPLEYRKLKL